MKYNFVFVNKGFTLIELIVSMGIFISLFLIVTVNFRSGESLSDLQLQTQILASDIRKVQTLSLAGAAYGGETIGLGGYGISLTDSNSGLISYQLFSDKNDDGIYTAAADGDVLSTTTLSQNINSLSFDPVADQVFIVFTPYSSAMSIKSQTGASEPVAQDTMDVKLTHQRISGRSGVVSLTAISGKVDFSIISN
ncbi:MAG: PilW family protein [Candidatus Komeilibacteria bacterium]